MHTMKRSNILPGVMLLFIAIIQRVFAKRILSVLRRRWVRTTLASDIDFDVRVGYPFLCQYDCYDLEEAQAATLYHLQKRSVQT